MQRYIQVYKDINARNLRLQLKLRMQDVRIYEEHKGSDHN